MTANPSISPERLEQLRIIARTMTEASPHARAIGVTVTDINFARVEAKLEQRPDLVGDPETGVIAGGVLTALLDHVCGAAVLMTLERPGAIATLDLRIDYMRPAALGAPILASAHCFKLTRSVAFVRATAHQASPEDPIATANAAFMLVNAKRQMIEEAKS